jgi:hypothetical protein
MERQKIQPVFKIEPAALQEYNAPKPPAANPPARMRHHLIPSVLRQVVYGGVRWCMVVYGDVRWCTVVYGGWCMVVYVDVRWCTVVHGGAVVYGGGW